MDPVDTTTADHYRWGDDCDGWRLLDRDDLSVIEERVPPGAAETRHRHETARQLFFVLTGEATMEIAGEACRLRARQAVEVPPGTPHQFRNDSDASIEFLVISAPTTRDDRVPVPVE